ncbi:uncharacterized protein H6S33_000779 [Morchella sextelata]|uniref:uncharacterized protein n=1 Tax=Morchella sextelata TaxID=1174677 RepID=UPI001D0442E1|nr:uncharacterized protein H6S33_000779 [Morchella sextelata]KAH0615143.1 hypothetical protein H6S33_000779 [Morchella sextelata]
MCTQLSVKQSTPVLPPPHAKRRKRSIRLPSPVSQIRSLLCISPSDDGWFGNPVRRALLYYTHYTLLSKPTPLLSPESQTLPLQPIDIAHNIVSLLEIPIRHLISQV